MGFVNCHHSKATKLKLSKNAKENPNYGMKGKYHSEKSKLKMSKSHKGKTYEEIYGYEKAKELKNKHSKSMTDHWNKNEKRKEKARGRMLGKNNPFYGKTHTKESLSKIKLFRKGDVSLRKGIKLSEEEKEKLRNLRLGVRHSKETIKKILKRRTPSSLESKMIKIIKKYNLPYKFVGDGKFFIERKNPDFININGEKIAIEVFYRKHKEIFAKGLENWKQKRKQIFNKYGWTILFFDETQVNENIAEILQ